MGTGKTSIARFLREQHGWHVLSTDAVRKQISGIGENTRVYVPYNQGLYSPDMNRKTYEEVCRRAENLILAGFPVAIDGAFKRHSERLPVIELAERVGARLLFLETRCHPMTQRQRLEIRRQHDTRSDGRVELMERQRTEFEAPDPEHAKLFETVSTDGEEEETREKVVRALTSRGMLDESQVTAPVRAS